MKNEPEKEQGAQKPQVELSTITSDDNNVVTYGYEELYLGDDESTLHTDEDCDCVEEC